jgi:hypothetical protein
MSCIRPKFNNKADSWIRNVRHGSFFTRENQCFLTHYRATCVISLFPGNKLKSMLLIARINQMHIYGTYQISQQQKKDCPEQPNPID